MIADAVYVTVGACWLGLLAIVVIGKRGAARGAQQRDPKSMLGMLLQCVGYAICFAAYRPQFGALFPMPRNGAIALGSFTIAIALASAWLCYAAARALGKHWALMARVIEGHELVSSGPYAIVRNPIYLAMLGMEIATGLAISRWWAIVAGIIIFLIGTDIRIRSEERILRAAFGAKFEDYARRVPALLPRPF